MNEEWIPRNYEEFRDIIDSVSGRELRAIITDNGRAVIFTDGVEWIKSNTIIHAGDEL